MNKWSALFKKDSPTEADDLPGNQQLNEAGNSTAATNGADKPGNVPGLEKNSNAVVYPPHPAAIALLLACCQHIDASRDELITELLKLKHLPPQEQVQRWALACHENGLLPERVIVPGAPSIGKAKDCMSCNNLEMIFEARHGARKQYHWSCTKQHGILEAYYLGERVLLAPDTCNGYSS